MGKTEMLKVGTGMTVGAALCAAQDVVMSKQYLVEGAKMICVNGSCMTQLKIPESHNYTSGGKKKANCKDCKKCENIPYFGECRKNEETHLCEGYMDLEEMWENTTASAAKAENVSGEDAINMSCVLLCKKGGIIIPVTSGQGYDGKINWMAFWARFQKVVRWTAGKNMLCHVFGHDPINMNTGNYIYEKEDLIIGGIKPLSFKLFYNTMDCGEQESLGEGWSHNFGVYLRKIVGEELVSIVLEDGKEVPYNRKLKNEYTSIMGDSGILKKSINGYTYESCGIIYIFDDEGKLKQQREQNGNQRVFTYNDIGLLVAVDNENGACLRYTYNAEKKLIMVEDHSGRKIGLEYQYGKLRRFTNSSGNTYEYQYNENGKLDGVITPRGILGVKNEYDGADRVLKQVLPDGGTLELLYDDKNNRTYMKEQNGNLVIYVCDEKMRNIRTIYEDGEETFAYNGRNQKIRYTNKNGNTTRYSYDNRGNLTQIINAMGQKIVMTYDNMNHMIKKKLPNGSYLIYNYDSDGNLIKKQDPAGNVVLLSYNSQRLPKLIHQADGSDVRIEYDSYGNINTVIDALGNKMIYEYDKLNRVSATIDGNGNKTRFIYNANNNIVRSINPDGYERTYEYGLNGKVTAIIDYDGSMQRMWYNSCNYPERYENQDGSVVEFQYDKMGNPTTEKLANGGEVHLSYDKYNRLTQYQDPVGGCTKLIYDACGNKVQVEDERGGIISFNYDCLNRITERIDQNGGITRYEYDVDGNLIQITDPSGNQSKRVYDNCGRVSSETDIYGNVTTFSYNSIGRPIKIRDNIGRTISYEYYPGGALKKMIYPDGTSEFYSYDGNRNILEKRIDNKYWFHYSYDSQNRIIAIKNNEGQEKNLLMMLLAIELQ